MAVLAKKRFLRDHILDNMMKDIHLISETLTSESADEFTLLGHPQLILPLTKMFELNKVVLEGLETVITQLKENELPKSIIDQVVDSVMNIQLGLVDIHDDVRRLNQLPQL